MSTDTATTAAPARKGGRKPSITQNKTELRKLVGQKGKAKRFTARELAEATEVTVVTAGNHLARLAAAGKVEEVGFRKTGKRGRPAREFVITKGK